MRTSACFYNDDISILSDPRAAFQVYERIKTLIAESDDARYLASLHLLCHLESMGVLPYCPGSGKYHDCGRYGYIRHALLTVYNFRELAVHFLFETSYGWDPVRSPFICGFFHDTTKFGAPSDTGWRKRYLYDQDIQVAQEVPYNKECPSQSIAQAGWYLFRELPPFSPVEIEAISYHDAGFLPENNEGHRALSVSPEGMFLQVADRMTLEQSRYEDIEAFPSAINQIAQFILWGKVQPIR